MSHLTVQKLHQYGSVSFIPAADVAEVEKTKTEIKREDADGQSPRDDGKRVERVAADGTVSVHYADGSPVLYSHTYEGQTVGLLEKSDELPGYYAWYDQGGNLQKHREAKVIADKKAADEAAAHATAERVAAVEAKPVYIVETPVVTPVVHPDGSPVVNPDGSPRPYLAPVVAPVAEPVIVP